MTCSWPRSGRTRRRHSPKTTGCTPSGGALRARGGRRDRRPRFRGRARAPLRRPPLRTGYVEAVATAPDRQGAGFGSPVMGAGRTTTSATRYDLGGAWHGPPAVLRAPGLADLARPVVRRAFRGRERTPDEDGYIMVLTTPTSPTLDLTRDQLRVAPRRRLVGPTPGRRGKRKAWSRCAGATT